ncbi:MAG: UDP-N-acetylglucosamine 1-carboxyvinyltransferase [Acidimicrobiales bacterium]
MTASDPTPPSASAAEPDSFVVRAGGPLHGTVRAGGAKNSALKLMAACLLAEGRHVLRGVPRISDVDTMAEILGAFGADVERSDPGALGVEDPGDLVIEVPATLSVRTPGDLAERLRASVVVLGPLLARAGEASIPLPGGDDFGSRPIDIHLHGLSLLGAHFDTDHGIVRGHVATRTAGGRRLCGSRVVFEYPSHTATDNLVMAAVLAEGTTVIENAAREPEVRDLAELLVSMGARISGAGTSHVEIEGVESLHPAPGPHSVIPDRVVASTFVAAAALAGGDVVIADARPDHMDMLLRKVGQMGVEVTHDDTGLRVNAKGRLRSVDVATLPYPGVATDYKPFVVTMLSVADGVGIVSENLFFGRFRYVDELLRMGADIRTEGHHAVVRGVPRLSGASVRATDLRAGAALVLAGMVADGTTVVSDAHHVDRGYDDLAGRLRSLGADITRS